MATLGFGARAARRAALGGLAACAAAAPHAPDRKGWLRFDAPQTKPAKCAGFFGGGAHAMDPKLLAGGMPMGHDLTLEGEHGAYMCVADVLYKNYSLKELRALEKEISATPAESTKYPTTYHIAVKNAISKRIMDTLPAIHCTCIFAIYHENNRMVAKGKDIPGEYHPNGEDFIRRKHKQMSWLFENRQDCSWSLLGIDDGCDRDSDKLLMKISDEMGYKNVRVVKLKDAVKENNPVLDCAKLKDKTWNLEDKFVKASQKGGSIIYGLSVACNEPVPAGRKHAILYTDSDLSTDLRLSGLNFDTMINQGFDCSVSERFGIPNAVNCSAKDATGGVVPGLARDSIVHLTLRHKLRMRLLPPLTPIIDTNCGHKGIMADAVKPVLTMVRDYKGSFDMDWLMCVGINSAMAGRKAIGVTPIAWVASVAESNFWGGGGGGKETAEEAKLKSMTSWFKIFKTMADMNGWHKDSMTKAGLLSKEDEEWTAWIKTLDVHKYMKLVDAIESKLQGKKDLAMPEPTIMGFDLATCKKLAGS
jgi:hypothetical protein